MAAPNVYEDEDAELRCSGTLHGIIRFHQGVRCIEHKCHHIACTKGKDVSVFHYHSLQTGDLVDTVVFANDPMRRKR